MFKSVTAGATSNICLVWIQNSATGGGLTGLVYNSSGLTAYYARNTANADVAIALVSMTLGSYTSSGFAEIDATNKPGWYQFCPPNAAFAAGAQETAFTLRGAVNMSDYVTSVDVKAFDEQTALQTVDVTKVNGSTTAASNMSTAAASMQTGTAVTGTLSTTVFTTGLVSTTVDEYKGRTVRFTGGALTGQEQTISAYSNTGQITVSTAFTTAPSNTDPFIII